MTIIIIIIITGVCQQQQQPSQLTVFCIIGIARGEPEVPWPNVLSKKSFVTNLAV